MPPHRWFKLPAQISALVPSLSRVNFSFFEGPPQPPHAFHLAQTLGCQFLNQDPGLQTDMLASGGGSLLPETPGSSPLCWPASPRWLQPAGSLPVSQLSFLPSEHRTPLSVLVAAWKHLYFFLIHYIIKTWWSCSLNQSAFYSLLWVVDVQGMLVEWMNENLPAWFINRM